MTPRKNLILALVIAAMAFTAARLFEVVLHKVQYLEVRTRTVGDAMDVQSANEASLFSIPGVLGTGVGWDDAGRPELKVFVDPGATLPVLPQALGGYPVSVERAGPFYALGSLDATEYAEVFGAGPAGGGEAASAVQDGGPHYRGALGTVEAEDSDLLPRSRFERPVPMGVSTGHTKSTAGTIGAVVTDGENRFALSNWHVWVPGGAGRVGDALLQPGPYDGGLDPSDLIGTLYAFEPVQLSPFASNRIDAAIMRTDDVAPHTPENGYGTPRSETLRARPGLEVKKYGRTTGYTFGRVDAINVSINVNYGSAGNSVARFNGQIITCCNMSQGGDSGSLIVAHDVDRDGNPGRNDRKPVALLFAGDQTRTIANPIDLVLDRFGVTIVSEESRER